MGQVTIYLEAEVEAKIRSAAKSVNKSLSKWVSDVIKEKTLESWPQSVRNLAGAWSDFPEIGTLREKQGQDTMRESL
jgi:hypothetical protein